MQTFEDIMFDTDPLELADELAEVKEEIVITIISDEEPEKGEEHAEHAGHGNEQHKEKRTEVNEEQGQVAHAQGEPQKQFAQLEHPADEDKAEQRPQSEAEQEQKFLKNMPVQQSKAGQGRLFLFLGFLEHPFQKLRIFGAKIEAYACFFQRGGKGLFMLAYLFRDEFHGFSLQFRIRHNGGHALPPWPGSTPSPAALQLAFSSDRVPLPCIILF